MGQGVMVGFETQIEVEGIDDALKIQVEIRPQGQNLLVVSIVSDFSESSFAGINLSTVRLIFARVAGVWKLRAIIENALSSFASCVACGLIKKVAPYLLRALIADPQSLVDTVEDVAESLSDGLEEKIGDLLEFIKDCAKEAGTEAIVQPALELLYGPQGT